MHERSLASSPLASSPDGAEGGRLPRELHRSLRWLRWASVLAPLLLVLALESSHFLLDRDYSLPLDRALLAVGLIVLALIFASTMLAKLETLNARLVRQNRELLGLHEAGLAVVAELSLESVLQKVVDEARTLIDARYGALSVTDGDDRIRAFITSGLDDEERRKIGDPPRGEGLLGVVLRQGQRLRLAEIHSDPRSVGFPKHHPDLRSLLAVPIVCEHSPYRGNLYVSEKSDGEPFQPEDEETLVRFATQAAIAIDNAYLHRRMAELGAAEERLYIAHDMHDGLAQLIAYVNAKVQAARENLLQGRHETAVSQLEQLASTAREAYNDVRGQILDLRSSARTGRGELADTLRDYIESWSEHGEIEARIEIRGDLGDLEPKIELQLLRIVQEALANVRKHAGARTVRVEIERDDLALVTRVRDDGRGFDPQELSPSTSPRFGLSTMRERAAAVGGRLEIRSRLDEGTTVMLHIPNLRLPSEIRNAAGHR